MKLLQENVAGLMYFPAKGASTRYSEVEEYLFKSSRILLITMDPSNPASYLLYMTDTQLYT